VAHHFSRGIAMTKDERTVNQKASEIFKIASQPKLAENPELTEEVRQVMNLSSDIMKVVNP
jgi:hypothetical protein